MKILVLTSRYTAARDVIGEDFGRQTRLFSALVKLGHEVDFFVADYRKHESKDMKLHGINVFIRPFGILDFFGFVNEFDKILSKKYDLLIATSDPLWGVIGHHYSKKHKTRFLYDLHDNYETYATYNIPFFGFFDRNAVKKADIVTTVSHALKDKIKGIRKDAFVLQNGVDLSLFRPLDKESCRKKLNLPENAKIIAFTGSLQKSLGIDILVRVFGRLSREMPGAKLLLVGRIGKGANRPDIKKPNIIAFDALRQKDVVLAINAADAAVIPSPENEFTKYCFPYKCVEYMACNTPIVASSLGDVRLMLKGCKDSLFAPGDEEDFYRKLKSQLKKGKINYRKKLKDNTWDAIALKLHRIIAGK